MGQCLVGTPFLDVSSCGLNGMHKSYWGNAGNAFLLRWTSFSFCIIYAIIHQLSRQHPETGASVNKLTISHRMHQLLA